MTSTKTGHSFGIDIGGSGIKGAEVDLNTGEFVGERLKIATPKQSTPEAVAKIVAQIVAEKEWSGPVGITLPSVVKEQKVLTAANIDKSWIGVDAQELFAQYLDQAFVVLNDADAAGLAEVAFGDEVARTASVIFLTLGTGIGSAFLLDGQLFPNTELGHMMVGDAEAEHQASSAVKEREGLKYKQWVKRLNKVLAEYEKLFNPHAFIIGGGISRKWDKWGELVGIDTPVAPAQLRNRAGIVGAAMAAQQNLRP
ncbi:polyphosphate--glucose phosphotransferase [Corynebacterium striatum]|uniref:ROK family protein n=1 Tax=Corynebacterium striatum TaxID=43770 RepID=A0ABX7DE08_CORST|nr:ROK family protein [Corynebacterium striatum]EGT5593824.1 ROK family protein [Corynebacterium striatum]MDK8807537.1 ROK family protein [Corynebacterium striatum]MDK8877036.1 ROK family protein [Corynebacterium striatum]QQU76931.1 ROK family protein [Corynebacterium striatum]CQD15618.1 Polyphosphate glucokinase [Corynebacterium striatum]